MYPSWLPFSDTPVKLHMKGRPQNSRSWPCIWSFWNWKKLRSHPSWTFTFVFAFWIFIVFLVPLRPLNQVISMNYLVLPKPFITQFIINEVRPWKSLLMILLRKAHRGQANNLGTGKYALFWFQIFFTSPRHRLCHISASQICVTFLGRRFLSHICIAFYIVLFDCFYDFSAHLSPFGGERWGLSADDQCTIG